MGGEKGGGNLNLGEGVALFKGGGELSVGGGGWEGGIFQYRSV